MGLPPSTTEFISRKTSWPVKLRGRREAPGLETVTRDMGDKRDERDGPNEVGPVGLQLRAAFSATRPLARRDIPLARARAFRLFLLFPKGSGQTVLY